MGSRTTARCWGPGQGTGASTSWAAGRAVQYSTLHYSTVYILGGREGSTVQYITLQYSLHPGRQGGRRQRRQLRLQAGGRRLAAAGKHGRAQDGLRMRGAPGGGHSFIYLLSVMLFSELLKM